MILFGESIAAIDALAPAGGCQLLVARAGLLDRIMRPGLSRTRLRCSNWQAIFTPSAGVDQRMPFFLRYSKIAFSLHHNLRNFVSLPCQQLSVQCFDPSTSLSPLAFHTIHSAWITSVSTGFRSIESIILLWNTKALRCLEFHRDVQPFEIRP